MAFGDILNTPSSDFVKSNFFVGPLTITFTSTPTAGNLILVTASGHNGNGGLVTPTGYAVAGIVDDASVARQTAIYWKIATGLETSVDIEQQQSSGIFGCMYEVEGPFIPAVADSATTDNLNISTIPFGSVTTTTSEAFVCGFAGYNGGSTFVSVDSGFTADCDDTILNGSGGQAGTAISKKLTSAGTETPTIVLSSNQSSGTVLVAFESSAADVTPPTLSLPTGVKTDDTTATGTVATDEGNGTLYYYASTNATETAATIKASGSSQVVSATGLQNVNFTGLTPSTVYYAHYVQDDSAPNESNVVSSTSFTTDAPIRAIASIDADNDVRAGQTSVSIITANLDTSPSTQIATLGGETITINSWVAGTVTVDIPLHIDLEWGSTTNQLALTDDTGTVTLDNITLSTPTGWETVTYNGTAPDAGSTESFYEYAQTDAGVGSFTMATNDILAWETQTGLTVDGQTIPIVAPPLTVSGAYKIWDTSLSTWTTDSTFTITDGGAFDTVPPILTSPTGTTTSSTTADGSVVTNEDNGTLYYYASTNSSETAATIKGSGNNKPVTDVVLQTVNFTGLTAGTTYYAHYVQDDLSTNESNVVSSASFTTNAAVNPVITDTLLDAENSDALITNETNLTVHVYDTDGGTELFSTTTATTNGSAVLTIDDDSLGSIGSDVFVVIKRTNGQTACGTMTVIDGA